MATVTYPVVPAGTAIKTSTGLTNASVISFASTSSSMLTFRSGSGAPLPYTIGGVAYTLIQINSSAVVNVPVSIPNATIVAIGGGGGGGRGQNGAAGGGGGGGVTSVSTTLSAGLYTVAVGAGGAGGLLANTYAGNGGNTGFGSVAIANGGVAGVWGAQTGNGGASGNGNAAGNGSWGGGGGGGGGAGGAGSSSGSRTGANGGIGVTVAFGSYTFQVGGGGAGGGYAAGEGSASFGGGKGGGGTPAGEGTYGGGGGGGGEYVSYQPGAKGGSGLVFLSIPSAYYPSYQASDVNGNVYLSASRVCLVGNVGVNTTSPAFPLDMNNAAIGNIGSVNVAGITQVPTTFSFTGADQTYVVPSGVTSIRVYMWGAAGGNGTDDGAPVPYAGGAGAMIQGVLSVTPGETLTIVVGEGGGFLTRATYGGGGSAARTNGSGGGRSAIRRSGSDIATAGAGGGGGWWRSNYYSGKSSGGSATFSGTANAGYGNDAGGYGQGGTQTAGGAPSPGSYQGVATSGGLNYGGNGTNGGSGGGSGYYGGGGSAWGYGDMFGAGGGGSSLTSNLSLIPGQSVLGYNSSDQLLAPNTTSPFYVVGVATRGGNGLVVITSLGVGTIGTIKTDTNNNMSLSATSDTKVSVNGGLTIANGYRPSYALVSGVSLTTSTTPAILATNYGTYFNITNSAFNILTLPTSIYASDANAYWVLRNSTGAYLSISVTYTGTGGGGASTITIPPANSTTIMFTSDTSGSAAYTFF